MVHSLQDQSSWEYPHSSPNHYSSLQWNLLQLTCGLSFSHHLRTILHQTCLPASLAHLSFGSYFNQAVDNLLKSLIHLICFNLRCSFSTVRTSSPNHSPLLLLEHCLPHPFFSQQYQQHQPLAFDSLLKRHADSLPPSSCPPWYIQPIYGVSSSFSLTHPLSLFNHSSYL